MAEVHGIVLNQDVNDSLFAQLNLASILVGDIRLGVRDVGG